MFVHIIQRTYMYIYKSNKNYIFLGFIVDIVKIKIYN